jgi:hypothetical protein
MSIFVSNKVPAKTVESKRLTSLSKRVSKHVRESHKSGPVFVTVFSKGAK